MQRGDKLTGSNACETLFLVSTGVCVSCVASMGALCWDHNFAPKSSLCKTWWLATGALLCRAIARQRVRFRKIACHSGHRAELACAQEFSAAASWMECCGASFARVRRRVGARTWPAFVVDKRFGRVSRHVWRAPILPLAVPIGMKCLGAHLPHAISIFGSLGEHTHGSVKTRFLRPGRLRAVGISAILQN